MHRVYTLPLILVSVLALRADIDPAEAPIELSPVVVNAPSVANQESVGTFAMPITTLRYEPLVDVQARNLAEGQADVSIRGGTFENTSFSIGALPIYDPQTGHYSAELPVAPAMLGAPTVQTGTDNAQGGWNSTAGSIAYEWQPIKSGGFVSAGAGDNSLVRGEAYAGYVSDREIDGRTVAADVDIAASNGEGTRSFGEHDFSRYNARLQLRNDASQTDFFAGHQSKEFSWVNLYTPYNKQEIEYVRTDLLAVNHRAETGPDNEYFQAGAYYRENRDRFRIPAFSFESNHKTQVRGVAFDGRVAVLADTALNYRAGVVADDIDSSALTFGRFNDRFQYYAGLDAEHTVHLSNSRELVFTVGAQFDDSNRDRSEWSPVAKAELSNTFGALRRVYVSYDESTQLPTYQALNASATSGLFRGDPNLPRAIAQNVELGAEAGIDMWTISSAVFARHDKDLLDYVYNPVVSPARQAVSGDLDTIGFETGVRHSSKWIELIFGYTFLHKDESYLTPGQSSIYAYNFADHRLTAAVVARLGAGFELRMDNEYRIQESNALRRGTDTPILSSLGLYYAVAGVKGLTLSAEVDNLWNTYYEEVPLVPGGRREWSVGARYAW
ncbi:MAG: TonB-dependent receptor [Opitutaceae bacterium]|jgi:hypothetical protein